MALNDYMDGSFVNINSVPGRISGFVEALDKFLEDYEGILSEPKDSRRFAAYKLMENAADLIRNADGYLKLRNTPWGEPQTVVHLGLGTYMIETEGHGGLYISNQLLHLIPKEVQEGFFLYESDGPNWAEEDDDLTIAMAFISHKLDKDIMRAEFVPRSQRHWVKNAQEKCATYSNMVTLKHLNELEETLIEAVADALLQSD